MNSSKHTNINFGRDWSIQRSEISRRALLVRRFCSARVFQRKMAQWQAIREFESLDNQYLEDIGIERYEIRSFVLQGKR